MPPTTRSNRFEGQVDLAILSDDGLRKIAEKASISVPSGTDGFRPALIEALRAAGLDKHFLPPRESEPETTGPEERLALQKEVSRLAEQVSEIVQKLESLSRPCSCPPLLENVKSLEHDVMKLQESNEKFCSELREEIKTVANARPHDTGIGRDTHEVQVRHVPVLLPSEGHAPGENHLRTTYANTANAARANHAPSGSNTMYRRLHAQRSEVVPSPSRTDAWNLVVNKRTQRSERPNTASSANVKCAKRIERSVHFVAQLDLDCTAEDVAKYCQAQDVVVTGCRVFPSRRNFGTACTRLVIAKENKDKINAAEFWPEGVTVRDWVFQSDTGSSANSD